MPAQYLIRFDDICPTMNWEVWRQVERQLIDYNIKPIVAIVPDNVDPELIVGPPRADFWDVVREWQASGWSIAVHGFQHQYVTKRAGIMKINAASEFAGVPLDEQRRKLSASVAIFHRNGVAPDCWVAPSHSFDWNTVRCLRELGIRVISDGLSRFPYRDRFDCLWVPQQLWRLAEKREGIWTACFHHNNWTAADAERFAKDVEHFAPRITGLRQIALAYASSSRRRDPRDFFNGVQTLSAIYRRRLLSRVTQLLVRTPDLVSASGE